MWFSHTGSHALRRNYGSEEIPKLFLAELFILFFPFVLALYPKVKNIKKFPFAWNAISLFKSCRLFVCNSFLLAYCAFLYLCFPSSVKLLLCILITSSSSSANINFHYKALTTLILSIILFLSLISEARRWPLNPNLYNKYLRADWGTYLIKYFNIISILARTISNFFCFWSFLDSNSIKILVLLIFFHLQGKCLISD